MVTGPEESGLQTAQVVLGLGSIRQLLGRIPSEGPSTIPTEQPSEVLGEESRQETAGKKLENRTRR